MPFEPEWCDECGCEICECDDYVDWDEDDTDPDGESFRGTEAAAFDREELMRIVEELK